MKNQNLNDGEDFSVAAVFSDECVLQRNKPVCIFGYGKDGIEITADFFNADGEKIRTATAICTNGRWELCFAPLPAMNGCSLKVSDGKNVKDFNGIAVGEVWLAGGQSNMEFELKDCTEGPAELNGTNECNVRFYYTNKIAWKDDKFYEAEKNTRWQTCSSEWKKSWSAVGYFFAKKLASELGVTVGVIGCNWGGTSASAWMRKEYLECNTNLKTYLDEQEEATKGKSIEEQCREYEQYEIENNEWQQKCAELYAKEPDIEWEEVNRRLGACKWPGPRSCKNPYRPTGLYDCMLSRIIPYTLKGVIWYQGECDDHKPQMYSTLFSTMIDNWRSDWHDEKLPFVFVQLPAHRNKHDKDFKHWCLVREAQAKVAATVKNAYMAPALDLGQFNDIHPKSKKTIAERLEETARLFVYQRQTDEEGTLAPCYENHYIDGNKITVIFANADDGFLMNCNGKVLEEYIMMEKEQGNTIDISEGNPSGEFTGFEIAGADGIFYPAQIAFNGKDGKQNTITLVSRKVEKPLYARYAWYNYGPAVLFGKNGYPLLPFRTYTSITGKVKNETGHAEFKQIMTV